MDYATRIVSVQRGHTGRRNTEIRRNGLLLAIRYNLEHWVDMELRSHIRCACEGHFPIRARRTFVVRVKVAPYE